MGELVCSLSVFGLSFREWDDPRASNHKGGVMTPEEMKIRILSFKELEKNWDSYGARRLYRKAITRALRIAEGLTDSGWFVAPMNDGGIWFENYKKRTYIQVQC